MDFASLMQAELDKGRQELKSLAKLNPKGKKRIRQQDLQRLKYEEREKSSRIGNKAKDSVGGKSDIDTVVTEPLAKSLKAVNSETSSKRTHKATSSSQEDGRLAKTIDTDNLSSCSSSDITVATGSKRYRITEYEVLLQLRERNQPIKLFGEPQDARILRLQQIKTCEIVDELGSKNDYKAAEDEAQRKYAQEYLEKSGKNEEEIAKENKTKIFEKKLVVDVTKEEVDSLRASAGAKDDNVNRLYVLRFCQYALLLWEIEIMEAKQKGGGRLATDENEEKKIMTIYNQTSTYLKPMLGKLSDNSLPSDISYFLSHIVSNTLDREYIKASEDYLQLSIGNAPWPIGVTMVGIHARTGREKIHAANVAHVLNDEEQRKYIQAFKRLMSFCQRNFPAAPSKTAS